MHCVSVCGRLRGRNCLLLEALLASFLLLTFGVPARAEPTPFLLCDILSSCCLLDSSPAPCQEEEPVLVLG